MSFRVMQTLRQFSPVVEVYSIDEAFCGDTSCNLELIMLITSVLLSGSIQVYISVGVAG